MNAQKLLERMSAFNESAVKSLNLAKLSKKDIVDAFDNGGDSINASDVEEIKYISYDMKKKQHVYGMVSYDQNEDQWYVNKVFITLGKMSIQAHSDGMPSFEGELKPALNFLRTFK